jgi:hypothetical protein
LPAGRAADGPTYRLGGLEFRRFGGLLLLCLMRSRRRLGLGLLLLVALFDEGIRFLADVQRLAWATEGQGHLALVPIRRIVAGGLAGSQVLR